MASKPLDLTQVRKNFPGLSKGWTLFDNAGGSQILAGAVDRITEFLFEKNVQIGGSYAVSQKAAEALRDAREAAATLMNAQRPEEVIFGPSTTVLLQNLARAMRPQFVPGDEIVVTVSDHESNIGPWVGLQEFGVKIVFWPLNPNSLQLEVEDLVPLLSPKTKLVCVTHVSNVLGQTNPIAEIARIVHQHGARICVDGVAYAPHRLIDVQAWDVDFYAFSLYKTFGPHISVMYGKYEHLLEFASLYHHFYGKEQLPQKMEPGNANYELAYSTIAIRDYLAGLSGTPAGRNVREQLEAGFAAITLQEDMLAERFLSYLRSRNDCRVFGQTQNDESRRIPTIAFRFDNRNSRDLCAQMDNEKIAIRHGDFHARRLLENQNLLSDGGVLRVSMVHYNTLEEVNNLCEAFERILHASE